MGKPNHRAGVYFTDEQAKRFRQLPHYEGSYRAAFNRDQGRAWSQFVKWGFAASKVVAGKRVYTKTPEGVAELLHYHVEHEMRDHHATFKSHEYSAREPLL